MEVPEYSNRSIIGRPKDHSTWLEKYQTVHYHAATTFYYYNRMVILVGPLRHNILVAKELANTIFSTPIKARWIWNLQSDLESVDEFQPFDKDQIQNLLNEPKLQKGFLFCQTNQILTKSQRFQLQSFMPRSTFSSYQIRDKSEIIMVVSAPNAQCLRDLPSLLTQNYGKVLMIHNSVSVESVPSFWRWAFLSSMSFKQAQMLVNKQVQYLVIDNYYRKTFCSFSSSSANWWLSKDAITWNQQAELFDFFWASNMNIVKPKPMKDSISNFCPNTFLAWTLLQLFPKDIVGEILSHYWFQFQGKIYPWRARLSMDDNPKK